MTTRLIFHYVPSNVTRHIYIHAKSFIKPNPLTMDYNIIIVPLNRCTKYHGNKTIMPKTMCKIHAQKYRWVYPPNLGSKKQFPRHCLRPRTEGLLPHWNPSTRGGCTALMTPLVVCGATNRRGF